MPTLKEPQKQIPGGFQFYVAETGWKPAPFSSLDSIVQQLIIHRKAQPYLTTKNGWSIDPAQVYQEVLAYQVAICVQMGWSDYLLGGAEAVPFPHPTQPSLLQKARRAAAGLKTIVSWRKDGTPVVPQELANKRAAVCTGGSDPDNKCPFNGQGGYEAYFTVPAANAVRAEVELKKKMKLETPSDDHLGVCEACDCPLQLKVWLPLDHILKHMKPEVQAGLAPHCWIVKRDA